MNEKPLSEMTDEEVLAAIQALRDRRATARDARATARLTLTQKAAKKNKTEELSPELATLLQDILNESNESTE